MPPSLASHSTYPSLTSEASSIASSDLPRTASELDHSPSPWKAVDQESSQRSASPRFSRRLFKLGSSGSHHHPSTLPAPTNTDELSAYASRHAEADARAQQRSQVRPKIRPREEATSWRAKDRTSVASAGLSSKHSSLGPLPIFPRPHTRTISRQSSITSTVSSIRPQQEKQVHEPETRYRHSEEVQPSDREPYPSDTPTPPFHRQTKSRPTLASLFQSAGRKALRRDDFRKDSYSKEPIEDSGYLSQSVPSTPLRRRFLGLKPSNLGETIRSARSTPAPPVTSTSHHIPTPSLPMIVVATPKGKENGLPATPILKRKRSSLPIPPKNPLTDESYNHDDHHHHQNLNEHGVITGQSLTQAPENLVQYPSRHTLRRTNSDSKHAHTHQRAHTPGPETSIRVPGPPQPHHPHPHPFFPCDGPLDRGLLSLPSFPFERPGTRPSTPRASQEFLPLNKGKRSRSRATDVESMADAEIRSVLAAGVEARRERRAPSRERLRVIEPLHRQHLPDVTGGDDQYSPDPIATSHPIAIPGGSRRSRTHIAHGLLPFESPAATPYGSRIDLPLISPTPTKTRHSLQAHPAPSPRQTHHRHLSSSATAVAPAPPVPQKEKTYVPFDDRRSKETVDSGLGSGIKRGASPQLYSGAIPASPESKRVLSSSVGSSPEYHRRGSSLNQVHHVTYRQGSGDSRTTGASPASYRTHHLHSQSLSGTTAVQGPNYFSPGQSPAGLGILLFPDPPPLSRKDRYYDLNEAMKLSIGDSRYKSFERAVRRYNEQKIALHGPGGLFDRVQRVLNESVDDGLPSQTARKYYQTFQSLILDA